VAPPGEQKEGFEMSTETMEREVAAPEETKTRKLVIICSKGSLDMAYPGLILANSARMSGAEAMVFFTFWGMDLIHEKKVDHLKVSTVGNPSMGMPTMLGGIPGMAGMATSMMKKKIEQLDLPTIRELIEILDDSGAELYGCRMAADMMGIKDEDLMPQVKEVITAMDFMDKSEGGQVIFV
jgi:peroxiredoxin family protein